MTQAMDFRDALQGINVVDFSWIGAGPLTAQWLANFGATVVKVEHPQHYDLLRSSPPFKDGKFGINNSYYFAACNSNKYGITLDLNKPKGRGLAHDLVRWADVLVENFMPGTMKRWGLDYDSARALNKRLIMISLSIQGQTGPHASSAGFGPMLMGLAGIGHLGGWPDRAPGCATVPYPDWVSPLFASFAIVSALDYRERTGEGQYIDLSQYEATAQFLGPAILDYTVNGRVWERAGNLLIDSDRPYAAPHGAYPTKGADRWCAVAVFNDDEWRRLVDLMGNPDWAADSRFESHDSRCLHTEELDQRFGQWTAGFDAPRLMRMLQDRGIAAGVVHDQQGVYEDPQLNARRHFQHLDHPEMGRYHVELPAPHLSATPATMRKASPTIGGDNDHVYKTILGLSQEEYDQLIAEEVIGYWEGD